MVVKNEPILSMLLSKVGLLDATAETMAGCLNKVVPAASFEEAIARIVSHRLSGLFTSSMGWSTSQRQLCIMHSLCTIYAYKMTTPVSFRDFLHRFFLEDFFVPYFEKILFTSRLKERSGRRFGPHPSRSKS